MRNSTGNPWPRSSQRNLKSTPCGYCFSSWATCWDHIIPYVYGGATIEDNLYPSCRRCNSILSDKVFDSLEEKREYIREELIRRNEWDKPPNGRVPHLRDYVPKKKLPTKVLPPKVQIQRLGPETTKTVWEWSLVGIGTDSSGETFYIFKYFKLNLTLP